MTISGSVAKIRPWTKALAVLACAVFAFSVFTGIPTAQAAVATISLSPSSGSFQVDSTFDVSIFLNTQGNSVNTIDLALRYPPDKLQLVSSGTGKSIIGLWTSQPKYNNQTGLMELTGGVPGGVNVERGLITTLTFRVKSMGTAVVRFERTRVLLNDGLGTEVLTQTQNSLYELTLPPPSGPVVVSDTHPDQTRWYRDNNVSLRWGVEAGADGFSYMISDNPGDIPDEISEGGRRDQSYRSLGDGRRYFHIRALRGGQWGGTTHFALNIDITAPAEYEIEIIPGARTSRTQPVIQFSTTDALSGTDHYELKLVPLTMDATVPVESESIFIEAQSPYIPQTLEKGNYDVIVRAYDKAGNYREVTQRLSIVTAVFRFIGDKGFEVRSSLMIPWWLIFILLLVILVMLAILARRARMWHDHVHDRRESKALPTPVQTQMDELQKYRERYGKLAAVALMLAASLFGGLGANAQGTTVLEDVFDAPLITTLSANITNEEIFYIGGKAGTASAEVVLYIQNIQTAETLSETIQSDKAGNWFYRHDAFLATGRYVLWAQSRSGSQLSPPSPQVQIEVEETAVQFGATRISYATLYLVMLVLSLLILIGMVIYIIYHAGQGKRKHALMQKEIAEAEESLRRGFAVLSRDIKAELDIMHRAKLSQKLSAEQQEKEAMLLKDLDDMQQFVSKEVWDIERLENMS